MNIGKFTSAAKQELERSDVVLMSSETPHYDVSSKTYVRELPVPRTKIEPRSDLGFEMANDGSIACALVV